MGEGGEKKEILAPIPTLPTPGLVIPNNPQRRHPAGRGWGGDRAADIWKSFPLTWPRCNQPMPLQDAACLHGPVCGF